MLPTAHLNSRKRFMLIDQQQEMLDNHGGHSQTQIFKWPYEICLFIMQSPLIAIAAIRAKTKIFC